MLNNKWPNKNDYLLSNLQWTIFQLYASSEYYAFILLFLLYQNSLLGIAIVAEIILVIIVKCFLFELGIKLRVTMSLSSKWFWEEGGWDWCHCIHKRYCVINNIYMLVRAVFLHCTHKCLHITSHISACLLCIGKFCYEWELVILPLR